MKTLLPRLLLLAALIVSRTLFAQLDLKFSETVQKDYVALDDFEKEITIPQDVERIELGFELESYGKKCSGVYVSDSYFFFDWMSNYSVEIIPVGLFHFDIDRTKGTYRIKHTTDEGLKMLVVEAKDLEYIGLPDQKITYQLTIREDSRITMHYGENTLDGNHPLNNVMAYVMITEEDFEKAQADPGGEDDYYRSIVNPFGDPSAPSLNVLPVANKLNKYPDPNTLYSVYRTSFTSISEATPDRNIRIYPNPSASRLEIDLGDQTATRLQLIDVAGKVVADQMVKAGYKKLSIVHEAVLKGQYLVRILNGDKEIQVKK